jgi:hypothetical protein
VEERLRTEAATTARPLDRLRKEIAHRRLLARIMVSAPQGSWALKGGVALLARLRDGARATTDADATWRVDFDSLEHTLDMVAMLNLHDGFSFRIGRPKPLTTETDEGGMRFPVVSMLAGREFERFHLDVNLVPEDPRPVETVALRNVLGFAGLDPPVVPVVPIAQHLAEKFHAHTRHYGGASLSPTPPHWLRPVK